MIPAKKDVIFYDAPYSMIEHYLNDVVVKELKVCKRPILTLFDPKH